MWNSLKIDWNATWMIWLESKINALNVSQIESGETEKNWVKTVSRIISEILGRIKSDTVSWIQ